jgi:hypothetical protein
MLFGLLALVIAGIFSGAALYINVAEQPARLKLTDGPLLAEWKTAYKHGLAMQAPLAFLGFVLGTLACYRTGHLSFLVGALLMIANWPWTLAVMKPTNKALQATPPEKAGAESRGGIRKWNTLHSVRTTLGLLAVLAFLLALTGWNLGR